MTTTTTSKYTENELFNLPKDGFRYELVRGELIKISPAGFEHGMIAMRLARSLATYVEENNLGEVFAAETGFKISSNPDTVLAADVSFVSNKRFEQIKPQKGFGIGAPDLVAEVISPSDSFQYVEEKVTNWLDAGTRLVIVVNPSKKSVTLYRSKTEITILSKQEEIHGQEIVPGWKMKISDLFKERNN